MCKVHKGGCTILEGSKSFNKYLLSTVLDMKDTTVNKVEHVSAFMELMVQNSRWTLNM